MQPVKSSSAGNYSLRCDSQADVDVEKKEIKKYQKDLLEYFDNVYPEIGKEIETTKQLSDELVEKIVKAAEEFRDKSR